MSRIFDRFAAWLVCSFLLVVWLNAPEVRADCRPTYNPTPNDTATNCTANVPPGNPVCQFIKSSSWNVTWPDCVSTIFTATCGGQRLRTKTGCCGTTYYEACFPSFEGPFTGEGYIEQWVRPSIVQWSLSTCTLGGCDFAVIQPPCIFFDSERRHQDRTCSTCPPPPPPPPDECDDITCGDFQFGEVEGTDCCPSPVLVDIEGDGFSLTDAAGGVNFDLNRDGSAERLAWTSPVSDEMFLGLDRNGNGTIDNGAELFGNYSPQASSPTPNGFRALAEYDKPTNGGNDDGRISTHDSVFSSLLMWRDTNHNGISEPGELHTLAQVGIYAFDLRYRESRRTDQYGNGFRYRANVYHVHGASVGRWAWDVFFTRQ